MKLLHNLTSARAPFFFCRDWAAWSASGAFRWRFQLAVSIRLRARHDAAAEREEKFMAYSIDFQDTAVITDPIRYFGPCIAWVWRGRGGCWADSPLRVKKTMHRQDIANLKTGVTGTL